MPCSAHIKSTLLAAVVGVAAGSGALPVMTGISHAADITTGLVGHWGFEEGTGSVSTADTATSGSITDTATFMGTLKPSYVTGRVGSYALDLTASNSTYLSVNASTDLAIKGPYTISGWFNLAHQPNVDGNVNPGLFNTRDGSLSNNFDLQIVKKDPNKPTAAWTGLHGDIGYGAGWLNTTANYNTTISPNTWYMVAYAVQAGEARIFIDGAKVATITLPTGNVDPSKDVPQLMASNSHLLIGQGAGADGKHLPGSVDDVRVYNRSLADADVLALYTASVPAPEPGSVGLLLGAGGLAMLKRRRRGLIV